MITVARKRRPIGTREPGLKKYLLTLAFSKFPIRRSAVAQLLVGNNCLISVEMVGLFSPGHSGIQASVLDSDDPNAT
jgi:hypothetical protein